MCFAVTSQEVKRRGLAVRGVRLDLRADQHLAPVGLRDVHVQCGRDEDHVEERFQRLGDERLERVRHDRHCDRRHLRDLRRPSGDGGDDHRASRCRPWSSGRFVTRPSVDVDAGDLGVLMDVDAHPVRLSRVGPHHRVVADHAAGRVVERRHDRELGMVGKVEHRDRASRSRPGRSPGCRRRGADSPRHARAPRSPRARHARASGVPAARTAGCSRAPARAARRAGAPPCRRRRPPACGSSRARSWCCARCPRRRCSSSPAPRRP